VKNAIRLLDVLVVVGVAVEVTHRAKRRLLGLKDMAPPARPCGRLTRANLRADISTHVRQLRSVAETIQARPLS
jgi:hypothetical protein